MRAEIAGRYTFFSIALLGFYLSEKHSFLLFHILIELTGVGVAMGIFFIAWNSINRIDNHYTAFIGIFHLFIAFISILHVLAYSGMNVFPGFGADLPTQLWIAGGYFQCLAFLGAPLFVNRKLNAGLLFWIIFLVSSLTITLIFLGFFPSCFIEGQGLTSFKKISEILISIGFIVALLPLWRNRHRFDGSVVKNIFIALIANSLARLAFIFYVSVYGLSNMAGHYLYLVYVYFIYKTIVETGISKPQELLFKKLTSQKEALENFGLELERKVRIRTKELEQLNEELIRSNKDLEDLAYIVSHDLREPLRGINNFSLLLLEDYGNILDEDGRFMLQTLTTLSKRQEEQIISILNYSRVHRKKPVISPVDTNEVLKQVLDTLAIFIAEKQVDIRIVSPLPEITCDREHLAIIFSNLITNAIKYNDKAQRWVEVGELKDGIENSPVLYVRDNGIGIAKKHQDKIFKIFKRLHGRDEFGGGTGAGLAITLKIIEKHHGRMWVESQVGEGTTIFFHIPSPHN
nr:hypothetical protein [Desulfobulbaceae bacterium]